MKQVLVGLMMVLLGATGTLADTAATEQAVAEVERAFAKTMADRDFDAFATFIDDEAVFWGGQSAARGKAEVLARWKGFFEGATPPFAWEPETVLVLASGGLALSTGPVTNTEGTVVAYFTSTWRKNADGAWKIVFDKGQRTCPPPQP